MLEFLPWLTSKGKLIRRMMRLLLWTTKRPKNITNILFTRNGIVKLLKDLVPKKASGPDNMASRFLKECVEEIADALVSYFMYQWSKVKYRKIGTLIYKGGNKSRLSAESYRPVSLTSFLCIRSWST